VNGTRRPFGALSSAWLVGGGSLLVIGALCLLLWSPWDRRGIAGGRTLRLYCAAAAQKPVAEVIRDYQNAHKVAVEATFGGSGEQLALIRAAGGAGDLYLAADALSMDIAVKAGLVAETIPVAELRPVLVVNKKTQTALRAQGKPVTAAADLLRPDLKVILANAENTSIGQLTRKVLEPSGLWAKLEERRKDGTAQLSTAVTVTNVASTVAIGEGYVGVVWDAIAAQYPDLEAVHAPEFKGVTEVMSVGVLVGSKQPTPALQFARYLTARDKGLEAMRRHHLTPPADADFWADEPKIHLAAGAMLMPAVEDVIKKFQQREGVEITTSYAGCGLLVSQMKSIKGGQKPGEFPDAYFACDTPFLDDVQQWFDPGVRISQNDVVFIVPKGNPKNIKPSLTELTRTDLRIGLAHRTKSALGKLTATLLKRAGLYEQVYGEGWQEHIVEADAAHDLVNKMLVVKDGGALDLTVVYKSNAQSTPANRDRLQILELKEVKGAHAVQPFAIASESRHKYLLKRLQQAIVANTSAEHFRDLGFRWIYKK